MAVHDLSRWRKNPVGYLWHYIARRPKSHALILCAVILAVSCSVSTQYGVKMLVDSLTSPAHSLQFAFVILLSLILADNLCWRVAAWTASHTFVQVTGDIRRDLFRHLTLHSHSYFSNHLAGVLTSRITAASNATFAIENMLMWNVLPPCLATIGAISFLATVDLQIAALLVVVAGIVVTALFRLARDGKPLHHEFAGKAAAVDGEMIDVVGNLALVKSFGGWRQECLRFNQTVDHELKARRRSLRYLEKLRIGHALVTVILTLSLLAWALLLWRQGRASAGDVVMVCTLGMSVLSATRDLAVALVDATQHMARLSEAVDTLLVPHQLLDHPEAIALDHTGADIVLENVAFGYPDGERIFTDFSLRIASGERVGLIGPSGSGKSTLVSLLQRFYALDGGRILINGHNIERITQETLWGAIATVPQDTALFNRSLLENIRYGRPSASDEEVRRAAFEARCDTFIASLPDGLDTVVGDRGLRLSGGQRQRIAIARAFLKNAPILLLDEATSALDTDSEEAIREALNRLMKGRTVIAITHRLSTLQNFDRLVVMKHGTIIEDGPPHHLVEQGGDFSRLIRKQIHFLPQRLASA